MAHLTLAGRSDDGKRLLLVGVGVTVLAGVLTSLLALLVHGATVQAYTGGNVMTSVLWVAYGLSIGRGETNFWGIPLSGNALAGVGAGFVVLMAIIGPWQAQVPDLLRTVEGTIDSLTADGAYDGGPTYEAARTRQPDPTPDVVIPPRASAVPSTADPAQHNARDRHLGLMAEKGRMEWQRLTGYGRRALAETAMGRWKHLIGPELRARTLSGQQGEVALAVSVLNRMTRTAKPVSVRVA